MAAPRAPRRNVRRGRCFLVMNIATLLLVRLRATRFGGAYGGRGRRWLDVSIGQFRPHLERVALHNSEQDCLHCVVLPGRAPDDVSNDGHINGLEPTTQGVD